MKRRGRIMVLGALVVGLVPLASQAQISSVTRRTFQAPPALTVVSATNAAPARVYVPPRVYVTAPKTEAEKQEELKRTIAFQQRCAEQGKPTFQYDLGLRYLKGDGVEQNLETARKWLKLAADRGHSGAKKKLEEMEKEKAPAPAE